MNLQKEFKILILPVLRGFPLLLTIVVLAFFIANYAIRYMVPVYEAGASIKLDNREHGVWDYKLFEEGGNGSAGSNFLTEVEIFKSKSLRKRALENLDFDVSYYRVGKVKTIETYHDSPFLLDYRVIDSSLLDRDFFLFYKGNGQFRLYTDKEKNNYIHTLKLGKVYADNKGISLRLRPNLDLLKEKPDALKVGDLFMFKINSIHSLVNGIGSGNFFVRPVDKDVYVVKLHYKNEVPEKAATFLNELIRVYIANDQENKTAKASKTLAFIDDELDRIGGEMSSASRRLAAYRKKHEIVNPKQETESILRQMNQYEINRISIDIEELELRNIHEYLDSDQSLSSFSPDFASVKDDVFKNAFIRLKGLEYDKVELSKKYPETSLEVRTINRQIDKLKDFVVESIDKKLANAETKRVEIGASIDDLQSKFKSYPGKERKLAMLQRDFMLKEETFNYLTKKQMELSISRSAEHPLHQIVDYANVPEKPVSPNRALIIGAAVFVAMLVGLALIYLLNFFFASIQSVEEIRDELDLPVLGTISKEKMPNQGEALLNLYHNIADTAFFDSPKIITIASSSRGVGKTYITQRLGTLLASYGKKVLLIDMNFQSPRLKQIFRMEKAPSSASLPAESEASLAQVASKNLDFVFLAGEESQMTSTLLFAPQTATFLTEMKNNYDVVLIDTADTDSQIDAAAAMRLSDLNLMIFRKGKSRLRKMKSCRDFIDSYKLKNIHCVLNGTR